MGSKKHSEQNKKMKEEEDENQILANLIAPQVVSREKIDNREKIPEGGQKIQLEFTA